MDRIVGSVVSSKLEKFTAQNPIPRDVPADDVRRLKEIATRVADNLPALADALSKALPEKLPPQSQLTPETLSAAQKLAQHLRQLVPTQLEGQVTQARSQAEAKGVDYQKVREQYDQLLTALPAARYYKDEVGPALVAFAANNKVTPDQLAAFEQNLEKIAKMVPLVAMAGGGIEGKLQKVVELVELARL